MAAAAGFVGVDTALGYGNQVGVGEAVRQVGRGKVFVTTKVPPCKPQQGTAAECTYKHEHEHEHEHANCPL